MREKDKATIERLREIVDFVEGMGKGIAVVENGDCKGWEDAKRVRRTTGASSVMIARGAESNPSCFADTPLVDVETTLIPAYLRVVSISCFVYVRHSLLLGKILGQSLELDQVLREPIQVNPSGCFEATIYQSEGHFVAGERLRFCCGNHRI